MNVPLTPLRFLHHAERQYASRIAVVSQGQRFTYTQFADRVGRLAGALKSAGIQPGERVAYIGVNSHRLLEAYYGVLEAEAIPGLTTNTWPRPPRTGSTSRRSMKTRPRRSSTPAAPARSPRASC